MRPTAHTRLFALGFATMVALTARSAAAQAALAPTGTQPAAVAASLQTAETAETAAVTWAGVYRVDLVKGNETVPARVVVDRAGQRLDGLMLVGSAASALGSVRGTATELRGTISTSSGAGELVLRATESGVAGTLKVGKATWTVTGRRSA